MHSRFNTLLSYNDKKISKKEQLWCPKYAQKQHRTGKRNNWRDQFSGVSRKRPVTAPTWLSAADWQSVPQPGSDDWKSSIVDWSRVRPFSNENTPVNTRNLQHVERHPKLLSMQTAHWALNTYVWNLSYVLYCIRRRGHIVVIVWTLSRCRTPAARNVAALWSDASLAGRRHEHVSYI